MTRPNEKPWKVLNRRACKVQRWNGLFRERENTLALNFLIGTASFKRCCEEMTLSAPSTVRHNIVEVAAVAIDPNGPTNLEQGLEPRAFLSPSRAFRYPKPDLVYLVCI